MRFFVLSLVTVASLVAISLRIVHDRNRSVNIGFQIKAATESLQALQEEIHQLRIDRAALVDPRRLTPKAQRLGLHVARPDEIILVTAEVARGP